MKRTKMARRKAPKTQRTPLGGHVPEPPENCASPVITKRPSDGTLWVDATLCIKYCGPNYCQTAKQHFAECQQIYDDAMARERARNKNKTDKEE